MYDFVDGPDKRRQQMKKRKQIVAARKKHRDGGSAPYVAQGVHFDGATFLSRLSLAATDNEFMSFYLCFLVTVEEAPVSGNQLWLGNPDAFNNSASLGSNISSLTAGTGGNGEDYIYASAVSANLEDGNWHSIIGTYQTNLPVGEKIIKYVIDGVATTLANTSDDETAFTNLYNALPFYLGSDSFGDNYIGAMADPWIAPGQSLLTDGDIFLATIRKFIDADGKPVYLGANGELPTGIPPAIFFSGLAASFPTNLGTGGAFTLTGTLTDAGPVV